MDPTTPWAPHHHGELEVAVGPIPHPSGLRDELVERRVNEVGEFDLGNGDQAVEGHADGQPHDQGFGERRVDDAPLAELIEESLGHPKHAAARADVLSQDDQALVGGHRLMKGVVDRRDDVLLGHLTNLRGIRAG
jgi:hypothetical protein